MKLLILALAPVFIIALYVYYRDKYEREPIWLLLKSLALGCLITVPVVFVERFLSAQMPELSKAGTAFYNAFLVAGFTEELFKYLAFLFLIWANKNFNEKFDGIVYAVFISLGFAAVENILYVFQHGEFVGYTRMVISVPAHALFGVTMGYYLGLAKFYKKQRSIHLLRSFLYPVVLHGFFDFILMLGNYKLLLVFIPFVIFLYVDGLRRMKDLSSRSIFRR
jgi:RsiW-degrading membrane proteinase PrsW (M82 family)